jgi:hypothetical protein
MNDTAAGSPAAPVLRVALGWQRAAVRPRVWVQVVEPSFDRPEIVNNHSVVELGDRW